MERVKWNIELFKKYLVEIKEWIELEYVSGEYINNRTKITLVDKEGYVYHASLDNLQKNFNRNGVLAKFFMNNPYTKENIQNYINKNNISVEIYNFNDAKSDRDIIVFKCLKHNVIFKRKWVDFRITQNCDICRKESINDKVAFTHEYIKNIIENEYSDWMKLKIIGGLYNNNTTRLTVVDSDGYKYSTNYAQLSNSYRNKSILSINKYNPYIIENIKKWLINNNRTEKIICDEFFDNEKLKLQCENGHIFYMDFDHIRRGQGCKICKGFRVLTLKDVAIEFKEDNKILLADKYINNLTTMPFICLKHKDKGIQYTNYVNFLNTKSKGCEFCYTDDLSKILSKSHDDFLIDLHNVCQDKFEVLSTYESVKKEMHIKCNTCNHEFYRSPKVLLRGGVECPNCEKHIGENHPNWKGGATEIKYYLREQLAEWKQQSLISSDYKCYITSKKGNFNVHHVYPFKMIFNEIFESTRIDIKQNVGDYTSYELDILKYRCLELHNKYGLGICMLENVHQLFHSLYGYNCTYEDIDEFKNRYLDSEFYLLIAN